MAATNPFEGAPGTGERSVLVDGVDRVLAARGVIAALAAEQSAERHAVEQDELDEEPAHDACQIIDMIGDTSVPPVIPNCCDPRPTIPMNLGNIKYAP